MYCRACVNSDYGNNEAAIAGEICNLFMINNCYLAHHGHFLSPDLTRVIDDAQRTSAALRLKSLFKRGAVHFALNQFTAANNDLHQVCLQDPTSVAPYVVHGKVLKKAGNYTEAEDCLDHAILLEGGMYELYVERGDIRMQSGINSKIIEAMKGALWGGAGKRTE